MVFCKDCKYFQRISSIFSVDPYGDGDCRKLAVELPDTHDPITGDLIHGRTSYYYAAFARSRGQLCGPDGKLFELAPPKPGIKSRVKKFLHL